MPNGRSSPGRSTRSIARFVSRVADGRKKPFDQIEPLAQGRVWLGAQAKENGLVDQLGGLDRAIEVDEAAGAYAGVGSGDTGALSGTQKHFRFVGQPCGSRRPRSGPGWKKY